MPPSIANESEPKSPTAEGLEKAAAETAEEKAEFRGDAQTEDREAAEEREAAKREDVERRKAADEAAIEEVQHQLDEIAGVDETAKPDEPTAPDTNHLRADALERALGVPIDKERAVTVMANSKTLGPIGYFRQALDYTSRNADGSQRTTASSAWKAFKMTFLTGGFRDAKLDAVFKNAWNNLSPTETQLHETLHAVSEGKDTPHGRDVLGGERAVSGVEQLAADGKTIKLTSLNEGLTQFFTLRARKELKMGRWRAFGAYTKEVRAVSRLADILDAAGQDGKKLLGQAYVERNADLIRQALDGAAGAGTFDRITDALDGKKKKEVEKLLAALESAKKGA